MLNSTSHVAEKRICRLASFRQAGRQQGDVQDLWQADELPVWLEHQQHGEAPAGGPQAHPGGRPLGTAVFQIQPPCSCTCPQRQGRRSDDGGCRRKVCRRFGVADDVWRRYAS